jgi:8-oxo-dGTP pyrophosphatase MutT (NUDIX family)
VDETAEETAQREMKEETGRLPPYHLQGFFQIGKFTLLLALAHRMDCGWIPRLCDENTDWVWADQSWIGHNWNHLHPGLREILSRPRTHKLLSCFHPETKLTSEAWV